MDSACLKGAGQESAYQSPVEGGDVGIAGDPAGPAGASDEPVIEKADYTADNDPENYFDHPFLIP
jgi:hypothetical protein